ncbi:non-specific serine/threonine protein kinase [Ranunculus cassubicifolius]
MFYKNYSLIVYRRMMKTYKSYVGNQTYPEGCITEQYLNVEAMRFCMEYIPANKRSYKSEVSIDHDSKSSYTLFKREKDYKLPTLEYQQARKWLLKNFVENAEWEG